MVITQIHADATSDDDEELLIDSSIDYIYEYITEKQKSDLYKYRKYNLDRDEAVDLEILEYNPILVNHVIMITVKQKINVNVGEKVTYTDCSGLVKRGEIEKIYGNPYIRSASNNAVEMNAAIILKK